MEDKQQRLTYSIRESVYRLLRIKAAQEVARMTETLEAAIIAYANTPGSLMIEAQCPSCEAALRVSTSGRAYLCDSVEGRPTLSSEALVLAEGFDALRERNPAAAEAVEALVRSL